MLDFFEQVLGILEAVWDFFINFLESLLTCLVVLSQASSLPLAMSPYLPTIISSCVISVVALFIVKFLIGR